jgi:aryl-alcohol dehydrogenase-like predicted oxidoreductase
LVVKERALRHGNQPALNDAVRASRWRNVGTAGERAWQLRDAVGVGPLAAVTRAVHGLSELSEPWGFFE